MTLKNFEEGGERKKICWNVKAGKDVIKKEPRQGRENPPTP